MRITVGSLFSGIGGLDLGLEWAGLGPVIWQVEREPFCRAVLAKHWPGAERFEDVCAVGSHCLRPVDLICGGFPCQDLSYAGKGAGLAGERSGLWREYARIVCELRPRFVVVENVSALLSRGLGTVLGDLAALGYDAEWHCIPAAAVGAPHLRDRLFIVAYTNSAGLEGRREPKPESADQRATGEGGAARPDNDGERGAQSGLGRAVARLPGRVDRWPARPRKAQHDWEAPRVCAVRRGDNRAARIKALGNTAVPQVAEVVGHIVMRIARRLEAA